MGEHDAHRQRMYQRFFSQGLSGFAEHEALEFLLFLAKSRGDTNLLAHRLIDRFGSLSLVLDAPEQELLRVDGVGKSTVTVLKFLPQMCAYYLNNRIDKKICLTTPEKAAEYLLPKFFGKTNEFFYLIPLDDKRRPLGCILLAEGTSNAAPVLISRIVIETARTHASCVVLAHNHPRGLPLPSSDDISSTLAIAKALNIINVELSDHFIIAENEFCSMRTHYPNAFLFHTF